MRVGRAVFLPEAPGRADFLTFPSSQRPHVPGQGPTFLGKAPHSWARPLPPLQRPEEHPRAHPDQPGSFPGQAPTQHLCKGRCVLTHRHSCWQQGPSGFGRVTSHHRYSSTALVHPSVGFLAFFVMTCRNSLYILNNPGCLKHRKYFPPAWCGFMNSAYRRLR